MRALIMAAGLGTRMRPLTNTIPKPLVPFAGKPMVEYVLERLALAGITEALINAHYLPAAITTFVSSWNAGGGVPRLSVQDESREILGSGGAVALAAPWLFAEGRAALVCNSDGISSPDLRLLIAEHERMRASLGVECTLAVVRDPGAGAKFTGLRVANGLVSAFEKTGVPDSSLWHFFGYYVIEADAIARMPAPGSSFSVMDTLWRPLLAESRLGAWEYGGSYFDLGSVADLRVAEAALLKG